MSFPVVAIVGRPNVGKSTLLNRIVGRREAIVEEKPGVTRDRKEVEAEWNGRSFLVVDTGGWMARGSSLDDKVSQQAEKAWRAADVVLFVVDTVVGATPEDRQIAHRLQSLDRPVLLVANKVDGDSREGEVWELLNLGLGDPWPVSALHGRRTGDLLDEIVDRLPPEDAPVDVELPDGDGDADVIAVAIVGRPNVGKSTLFNRLIGDDRSVVHDMPGTTRDAVDTVVDTPDGRIRFVDTAGMRRKSRIDAAGSPVVVLLNKWELLDAEERADVTAQGADRLRFLSESPVLKGSALTGKGVHRILPALAQAVESYQRRVPTRELNQVIQAAQAAQPSPTGRVLYATQGATEPPTFTLFANRELPPTYLRYLERKIREHFDFGNTPLKLRVRRRSG